MLHTNYNLTSYDHSKYCRQTILFGKSATPASLGDEKCSVGFLPTKPNRRVTSAAFYADTWKRIALYHVPTVHTAIII